MCLGPRLTAFLRLFPQSGLKRNKGSQDLCVVCPIDNGYVIATKPIIAELVERHRFLLYLNNTIVEGLI